MNALATSKMSMTRMFAPAVDVEKDPDGVSPASAGSLPPSGSLAERPPAPRALREASARDTR
ncbi:hypothetical protein ALMP_79990 [Streptomyces sp. A012304]|nr:hypothetical protein ALMP_79990 [Streptomyces sp. A012304]